MEIIYILIPIILGVCFGIIAGLIPGIHINLISTFILTFSTYFLGIFDINQIIIFIITMSTIFSFVSFIPATLFGVPDSDTSLSILPGHKMVLEGKANTAIYISSLGSLAGAGFSIIIGIIFYFILEDFYTFFKEIVPYFLIISLIILIFTEKTINNKFWALIIILFSAGLGSLVLNSKFLDQPLLVLFTGLFGVSTLIYSLNNSVDIPKQENKVKFKLKKNYLKGLLVGGISSAFCSVTPGIGNAQAATISSVFFRNLTGEIFLFTISSINTINFIVSLITFYVIERSRNGSIYVISQLIENITLTQVIFYFSLILVISTIGFFVTIYLGKVIIKHLFKVDQKKLNIGILIFLFLLVFSMTGVYGILILICSAALGLLCITIGIKRVHLMGVLAIPVIITLI